MKKYKGIVITFAFVLCFLGNAFAQASAKEADIKRLLRLIKLPQLVETMVKPMMKEVMGQNQYAQAGNMGALEQAFDVSQLENTLIELYDKYFSHEEIKEIIRFYQTSTGQKLINAGLGPIDLTEEDRANMARFEQSPTGMRMQQVLTTIMQDMQMEAGGFK